MLSKIWPWSGSFILIDVVFRAQLVWRARTPLSIQSYPFNLNACGAAVTSVNSDNKLDDACGREAVRRHAAVKRVKNGPDEPDRPNVIPFDLDNEQEDTNLTNQDDATSSLDASAELMRWHLRLGHLPFANIRLMAARKEIPSRLANC
jgi:hypothetical protein